MAFGMLTLGMGITGLSAETRQKIKKLIEKPHILTIFVYEMRSATTKAEIFESSSAQAAGQLHGVYDRLQAAGDRLEWFSLFYGHMVLFI